MGNIFFAGGD